MTSRRVVVAEAEERLRRGGVASPRTDAEVLLAHVLGRRRGDLVLVDRVGDDDRERFDVLIERRAAREPLQHLTGSTTFRRVELAVGPGVFVPRPETELLAGWAVERAADVRSEGRAPVVVDLCCGSGAIARAVADEAPDAEVHAVELEPAALRWAERNLAGTGVQLHAGDLADPLPGLEGRVDVVVCNPPYIPWEAWESVAPEAREHDPHAALFAGDDGLAVVRVVERRAHALLLPGGVVGVEHADLQGESAPGVFVAAGRWRDVRDHPDLTDRPRYLTARAPGRAAVGG